MPFHIIDTLKVVKSLEISRRIFSRRTSRTICLHGSFSKNGDNFQKAALDLPPHWEVCASLWPSLPLSLTSDTTTVTLPGTSNFLSICRNPLDTQLLLPDRTRRHEACVGERFTGIWSGTQSYEKQDVTCCERPSCKIRSANSLNTGKNIQGCHYVANGKRGTMS